MNNYYVYGLFEESGKCFYIGKGKGRRMYNHRKNFKANRITNYFLYCKLKSLQNKNENFEERIIIPNLTEDAALREEKILIEQYGRKINGGTLCNFIEGGTQPPSVEDIKNIYGEDFYKQSREKQQKTFKETCNNRGLEYISKIKKMLEKGYLIKDISSKINVSRYIISKWIKIYNLKYDDSKKKFLERERLKIHRKINSETGINKVSKIYTIITPNGETIITRKLIKYCQDNNLDYKNLRNTYKKIKSNGENSKSKGYYIIKQENP